MDAGAQVSSFQWSILHEARKAVEAAKYPPMGKRSFGLKGSGYGVRFGNTLTGKSLVLS